MSDIDPFAETIETPAGGAPVTPAAPADAAPAAPAPAANVADLFATAPAAPDAPTVSYPVLAAGQYVREETTGRTGIVLAAGELEGGRNAVIVGWFESVSHPILTDALLTIGG